MDIKCGTQGRIELSWEILQIRLVKMPFNGILSIFLQGGIKGRANVKTTILENGCSCIEIAISQGQGQLTCHPVDKMWCKSCLRLSFKLHLGRKIFRLLDNGRGYEHQTLCLNIICHH